MYHVAVLVLSVLCDFLIFFQNQQPVFDELYFSVYCHEKTGMVSAFWPLVYLLRITNVRVGMIVTEVLSKTEICDFTRVCPLH